MAAVVFTNEQLNYFRVCYVTTRIVPEGLRTVFKREWDTFYQASHGAWQDRPKNGNDFFHLESLKNQKRNARLLAIMKNGNTDEWDCTCLFYSMLFSDSLGSRLATSVVERAIDVLREFRNEVFAHTTDGELTEADFQACIGKVENAFNNLKLDTSVFDEIKNQKSFPTQELDDLRQQLIKEKKRNEEPVPFCVLPPKPSHKTADRTTEVEQVIAKMQKLKSANKDEVIVVYFTGNPGCGKSQVARQIGEKINSSLPDEKFVFTFNASNENALLQSYLELASLLKCDEHSLAVISTVKDLTTPEKLEKIRMLVAPKILRYSSWLMILDNVSNFKSVCQYFPKAGDKTSGEGQIIVTTQDSRYIPQNSAHTYQLSLSTGMQDCDAVATLTTISGLPGEENIKLDVAKELDFQPLALACAAVYMQRVACSKPSWTKYLQKLEEGRREGTEEVYMGVNMAYPSSMTRAVKIAVRKEVGQETCMMHTFRFLSVIAAGPISLSYVVRYVHGFMSDKDEEILSMQIRSSSLILWSEDDPDNVRVHQVIYNHLQTIFSEVTKTTKEEILLRSIITFANHKLSWMEYPNAIQIRETKVMAEHFVVLADNLKYNSDFLQNKSINPGKFEDLTTSLSAMGNICRLHGEYATSKRFLEQALNMTQNAHDEKNPVLAGALSEFGLILRDLGEYQQAKTCMERALAIEESVYDTKHPTLATTLSNLGLILQDLGEYQQAKTCMERALAIQESVYDTKHPTLATTLSNLGLILRNLGEYQQAKTCMERALAIKGGINKGNRSDTITLDDEEGPCALTLSDNDQSDEHV